MGKLIKIFALSLALFFLGYIISDYMGKDQTITANILSFLALIIYCIYLIDKKKWKTKTAMIRAWLLLPLRLLYFIVICATGFSHIFPYDIADMRVVIQSIYYFYIAIFLTIIYILQVGERLSKERNRETKE